MVILETAFFFLAVVALAMVCGYGIVTLLLPDKYRDELAFVAMPPIGYCFHSWLAFDISGSFGLPGRTAVLVALAVSVVLGLVALRLRPPTRAMLVGAWPTLPLSLLAAAVALWPLFYVGATTFLGAVNPDYMATLADIHHLHDNPLRADTLSGLRFSYSYFYNVSGAISPSARFGSSYFVLLVKTLLGLPHRTALTLCIGFFVFTLSLSVYFMARVAFGFRRRAALIASVLILFLSPVTMSYVYFYVGQNSGLGVLPLTIAVTYLAVRQPTVRTVLLATLLLDGLYIMYTAMVPYVLAPVGVVALFLLLRGEMPLKRLLAVGAGVVGMTLVLNVGLLSFLAAALKVWNRLVTQTLQGQYFIDFLTEQFLPLFLGLISYPISASVYGPFVNNPSRVLLYALTLVVIGVLVAATVRWSRGHSDRPAVVLGLAAATIYGAVWWMYTFQRPYGYALFKMCSWLQFIYVLPLAYALDQARGWRTTAPGLRRWASGAVWPIAVLVVVANLVSAAHLTRLSLGHDTRQGMIVNLYDMSGNEDYLELADRVREHMDPGAAVGLSFLDSIQNQWASYYLRDFRTSLLGHNFIPADDENLPGPVTRRVTDYYGNTARDYNFYFHGATDDYLLTWSDRHRNRDIVERRLPPPIWENGTFRLQRAADCPGFIYTGRGWYRLEFRQYWAGWWPDRFRWTAEGGEIYMLRGKAGQPYRLSFVGIVGHGLRSESRTAELWHNNEKFDDVSVTATGRVVSKPFYSTGDVDRLVIKLKEKVEPPRRAFRIWNRNIPDDYRRLNLLVAGVKVLTPDDPVPEPSTYTLTEENLFNQSFAFDGLQPDRWAGRSLALSLKRPTWARTVALSIFVPGVPEYRFPYTVQVSVDGTPHEVIVPRGGPFRTILPLGPPRADGIVTIRASASQVYVPLGVNMESHPVYHSFRVELVGLQP